MEQIDRTEGLKALIRQGLQAVAHKDTLAHLGDRSTYIGMSDIGQHWECPRAALARKVLPTTNIISAPSDRPPASLENLPPREGITYQQVTAQDGRPCIIATGNTQAKKELLTGSGFRWNPQRKLWWKYVDAA